MTKSFTFSAEEITNILCYGLIDKKYLNPEDIDRTQDIFIEIHRTNNDTKDDLLTLIIPLKK